MSTVTVIDYGVGNLLSVIRAFESCGAKVLVTDRGETAVKADRLVLPGVGAFSDGMRRLLELGLVDPIVDFVSGGRPFLGICLGMQMMMDFSEEFGITKGLGIVSGKVVRIPSMGCQGLTHKIPHIGWNSLLKSEESVKWQGTILRNIGVGAEVYFIHSFTAFPNVQQHRLADARYDGCLISAAIRNGNAYGCQFHPEKSGKIGLQIISNFLSL